MTAGMPRGNVKNVDSPARAKTQLISLLLLSLVLRLAWGLSQKSEPDPSLGDQFEYLQLGRNLLSSGQLRFHDERFEQWVYAYRTPGYPLLIAACAGNVRAVRVVQAVIDTSTVLAIYLLSRRFLTSSGALVAAGLVSVNPFLIYFSGLILSETLFTAMLAWGMYLLVRQRTLALSVGVMVLALATLVRPSALGLIVLLPVAAAWTYGWRAMARNALLALLAILLVLAPWAYRNAYHPQVSAWIWTTTNSGITTYDGFHDRATGASDQKAFLQEMRTLLFRMDEVERDAYLSQRAHEWIRAHPAQSLKLMGMKILRTWSPVPLSNEYGSSRLYVAVGLCYGVPFDILILLGLWKGMLPRTAKVLLLLPAIYFTGIHASSVGSLRYRIPFEPPMAVIAGSWALCAWNRSHGSSRC
ncbi:MAG: family glycosyltransferase, 4-amino-4-deoxy-L-arabinose transferase [Phycisphaerales bacterium]|nr:family glycosyltransferase, 4-amino-4-deoxy-L-arabinose transferase [Phycisphaerales bacterium]